MNTALKLPAPWSHAPCGVSCPCGACLVVAVHNDITGRERLAVLRQAAAVMGWYEMARSAEFTCPLCYGSAVLDAIMRQRAGDGSKRRTVDEAADRRAGLVAFDRPQSRDA